MNSYEINDETLAVIPKNNNNSIVYEKESNYIVNESVDKIMEDSCKYFGSTLEGRQEGAASILNITHKVPIIVEETSNLLFFPTASPRKGECAWISLNNIEKYEKDPEGSKITFKDGTVVKLPISYGMLNNQVLRSSRLQYLIDYRKSEKSQKKAKNTKKIK